MSERSSTGRTGKTILITDDDPAMVTLMSDALAAEGFTVFAASNGEECLLRLTSCQPDLVVMDLGMPCMGGLEVLRTLRQNALTRLLPVIIVTGNTDYGSVVDGWMSGAESFLRKPVSMETLLHEVTRLVGQP